MPPKVSVIVPNYNHADFLHERIESILNQTYQDFEIILLDDHSSDKSIDILNSYKSNPKVSHIIVNETNGGTPFKQWNKGIELAQGEWIWIAESDDVADTLFLETLIKGISEQPQCGLAYTWTRRIDTQGNILHLYDKVDTGLSVFYNGDDFLKQKMLFNCTIDNVSECIFKKSAYSSEDKHLYENMRLCGDWFFYTLIASKSNVLEIQKTLSNYRMHLSNVTSLAEHNGLTFIEGINILDFIVDCYNIPSKIYAKSYGRYWLNATQTYKIPKTVNQTIRKLFFKRHKLIVLWHDTLAIYRLLKTKKHLS